MTNALTLQKCTHALNLCIVNSPTKSVCDYSQGIALSMWVNLCRVRALLFILGLLENILFPLYSENVPLYICKRSQGNAGLRVGLLQSWRVKR